MTTTEEVEWEDVTYADLRIGDEVEYIQRSSNREFKYWGKVLHRNSDTIHVEGDWHLLKSTWNQIRDGKGHIRRKVVEFELPETAGSVLKYTNDDRETTYVRVKDQPDGYIWIETKTGDRYATWEIELLHCNDRVVVISDGTFR